jgi:STE24 endopeptidase
MPKSLIVTLLFLPFALWDAVVYGLRQKGDRSARRRADILRHFTPEEIQEGREHQLRLNRLFPFSRLLHYLFFGALLFGGLAQSLETALLRLTGQKWVPALPLFILVVIGGWSLLHLPLDAYREFVIEREAGLSTMTLGLWMADLIKSLGLGVLLATLFAFAVILLIRGLPQRWPLAATATLTGLSAFGQWIAPWLIAPLFNRFWSLPDSSLRQQLHQLIARAGIGVQRILVMDASKRSTALNAYFTGLGNSQRVVLYDTLVKACNPQEILSVVAHELGHWKGHHILKFFLLQTIGLLFGMDGLKRLLDLEAVREFFNVPSSSSFVLLILFPFLADLLGTALSPIVSALSRRFERAADRTALHLVREPQAFISLQKLLVKRAKGDLLRHPLLHFWYGSHPLPEERIRMAEGYPQ